MVKYGRYSMKGTNEMDCRFNSALVIAGAIIIAQGSYMLFYIGGILILTGIILQLIPFIKKRFK